MDPKRIVEQGYDRLGSRYWEWTKSQEPGVRQWFLDEVLQRLPAGADVLELGCGPGTVSPVLADGRRYTGVDLSAQQLALARERLPDATFIHGDFTTTELPASAFDAVVAFFVVNHVPRAEHAPMFARVFSWLRPGGRFMLSLGADDTDDEIQEDWIGVPMFFAGFQPGANERSLRDAGFELELSETRSESQSFLQNLRSCRSRCGGPSRPAASERSSRSCSTSGDARSCTTSTRSDRAGCPAASRLSNLGLVARRRSTRRSVGSRRCTAASWTTFARFGTKISRRPGPRTGESSVRPAG
jgi:SAM-dependent methyltransferase